MFNLICDFKNDPIEAMYARPAEDPGPDKIDVDIEQWRAVADVVTDTGAVPFVDIACQDFGEGSGGNVAALSASQPSLLADAFALIMAERASAAQRALA